MAKNLISHKERSFSGGDFTELQYCRLKKHTLIKEIVSVVEHQEDASLYIFGDDRNDFSDEYGEIIKGGTHQNLESGYLDIYGINYFSPQQTEAIIKQIEEVKPKDCQALLNRLKEGRPYNGFYLLGV